MTKWVLALGACAVLAWWLTRPKTSGAAEKTRLARCEKCGVYRADGEPCDCEK